MKTSGSVNWRKLKSDKFRVNKKKFKKWIYHDFLVFFDEIMKLINVFIFFDFNSKFAKNFSKMFSVNCSFRWIFWLISCCCFCFSNKLWFFRFNFCGSNCLYDLKQFVFYKIFDKFVTNRKKIKNDKNVFNWQR